ncbi:MAG: AAA family ATPase [Candidatus Altiarchaeota archaeon]|nr:AAA family ATPase [Candidatus Altiarchaeota archaeon]
MKFVIGLAGTIGSGKTIVSEHIHKKYGAGQKRFSQILMDILDRLYLPHERSFLQKIGASLRESLGDDVIVNTFKRDLKRDDSGIIVIDGIRYTNEVDMLRKFRNNILLSIDAPPELRYERCRMRGEKGEDKISIEEFLKAEKRETERHIPDVAGVADYCIENTGSVEELLNKIDDILKNKLK